MGEPQARQGGTSTAKWAVVWEPMPNRRRWSIIKSGLAVVRDLTVIVGLVSAVLSAIFLIAPNLGTSTQNTVKITQVSVEPDVTEAQYFQHYLVTAYLRAHGSSLGAYATRLSDRGVVVDFVYQLGGLRAQSLPFRWTLFDAKTRDRVAESESLDPLPIVVRAEKKNADVGSWEAWIDTSRVRIRGRRFFARLELYDKEGTTRLAYAITPVFAAPPSRSS